MEILNKKSVLLKQIASVIFLTAIGLAMLPSCRKEASVKIPETVPKAVLVSFISPEDNFITVKLTNSIPLYSTHSNAYPFEIKNATITISNGSLSKTIPWYKDSVGYRLSTGLFPVNAGATYTIDVKIPDGRILKAKTTVPAQQFPQFNFSLEKNLIDSNEYSVSYEFIYELSWNDIPGSANFYRSVIYNLYSDSSMGTDTTAQIINEIFENDEGKDGAKIKLNGQSYFYYVPGTNPPLNNSNYVAYMILCNKAYYDYHKDLYINNDVNPFSEAKINFTNIEGGIGCFSAYRLAKIHF